MSCPCALLFIVLVASGLIYGFVHYLTPSDIYPSSNVTNSTDIISYRAFRNTSISHDTMFRNHTHKNTSLFQLRNKTESIAKNLLQNRTAAEHDDDGCICKTYSCSCCATLYVPEIGLNDTACLNFAYLPKEYGISVTLTIDGDAIINETISERNPPPLCMEPPYMDNFIHICIRFYDLDVTSEKFHGCVQLEMKMFYVFSLKEWKLGCFDLDLLSYKQKKYLHKLLESASKNVTESNSVNSKVDWKAFKKVLLSKMNMTGYKLGISV